MEPLNRQSLSPSTLIIWGLAQFSLAMIGGIYGALLPIFYQDYLGLAARWIGIASLVYALWNAINDPLFGFITDNTRSCMGRRIPYMRFTAPFLALTFLLVWMVPGGMPDLAVFWWMLIAMLLYDSCFTIIGLVYSALLPEISENENDRGKLQISSALFGLLGFAVGFVIPELFRPRDGASASFVPLRLAMLAVAILGAFLIILVTLRVKERPALSQHEEKMSFKDYLTFTFTSKSGLILIAQNFMRVLVQSITIGSIFYVADYLIRINSLVLLAAVFAPMIIGIAVSGQIRRRMGALGALQLYLILGGLGLLSVMIMPAAFLPISYMLVGFGMAGPEALTYLLFAQVIDEDELRSGQRREGAFFGTNALLTKPAQSLAIAIPPFILEATGFVTREANGGLIFLNQGESALTGIRIFAGLIPGIAFLAGAAILLTYPIKGSRLKEQEEKILALHQKKEADYAPEA
jgi:GPH family glycoside/pentoside/hexuronide:cation symporter